jgi:hypothetical protein
VRSQRGEIGQGFVELPAQFILSTPSTPPTQQE